MNAESVVNALREVSLPAYAGALGLLTALVTGWLTARALRDCDVPSTSAAAVWGLIAGLVTVALTFALLEFKVQETPDVRPSELWWRLRPMYYAILVSLLTVATATDLKTYYILDWTTVSGMVLGVAAATLAGDLQLCHVWVDWNAEVPQLRGPEIPAWLGEHPHWHGLAWSVCGLLTGAGVTWAARFVSSLVLGQQALGFGDVTLMGMIGAFVGWQAVLIVFLLAPLCAVLVGLAVKVVSSRTYIPYGPYLALGAMLVLFNWRTIWLFELDLATAPQADRSLSTFALRRLFGDAIGLMILAGMLVGGMALLLGAWRLYLSIPVETRRKSHGSATEESHTQPAADAASE